MTPEGRRIIVDWPGFGGKALFADFSLRLAPSHQSTVVVIPIRNRRFYYNRKINCLPAAGWVKLGDQAHELSPQTCLGNLDWGRGVWEYKSFWVWASASGFLPDRRTVGLNLGHGFGDTSAATENTVILDGCIHKLGQVNFTYDSKDFKRPWRLQSPDGRLALVFTPFLERVAKTNLLVINSEVHQMFGRYSGTVVADSGEQIKIHQLIGFAEEQHAHWQPSAASLKAARLPDCHAVRHIPLLLSSARRTRANNHRTMTLADAYEPPNRLRFTPVM